MSLPSHWTRVTLKECCVRPDYGYTASASTEPIGPRFLRITDIQDGKVDWERVPYVGAEHHVSDASRLKAGDIVIARIGATTGKAFLIGECPEAVFASYLIRVRTKPTISSEYLSLFFQSADYWNQIEQCKGGRLKGGVNIPNLENLSLFLPPLPEQMAIAQILKTVQRAKDSRHSELMLERERKAALMEDLFSFGAEEQRKATERTPYGRVPSEWPVRVLDDCAFIQTGVAKGRKFKTSDSVSVPYLRVANVQNGYLNLEEMKEIEIRTSELPRYRLAKGDVVLTEGGDFDKLGRGFIWNGEYDPCVHQNHVFAVRPKRDIITPDYFAYLAQSPYGRAYFLSVAHKTTNLACINKTKLGNFPVLIPSLDEQEKIATILKACDSKIAAEEREVAHLQELFDAMLSDLFAGKCDLTSLMAEEVQA